MRKIIAAAAVLTAFAAPASFAADSLAGLYVGGNLGLANASTTTEDSDCYYECSAYTLRSSGPAFGLKLGQNFTSGGFLYGWDVDYNFASADDSYNYAYYSNPDTNMQINSKLKSTLSLRGKAGLVIQDTALALSFGYAMGDFDNEFRDRNGTTGNAGDDYVASSNGTVNGWVYGASIQHSITPSLVLSANIDKYAFETDTQIVDNAAGTYSSNNYHVRFVNDLDAFTLSLAYKFF